MNYGSRDCLFRAIIQDYHIDIVKQLYLIKDTNLIAYYINDLMQSRDKRFLRSSGSPTGRGQVKGSHFRVRDVKG